MWHYYSERLTYMFLIIFFSSWPTLCLWNLKCAFTSLKSFPFGIILSVLLSSLPLLFLPTDWLLRMFLFICMLLAQVRLSLQVIHLQLDQMFQSSLSTMFPYSNVSKLRIRSLHYIYFKNIYTIHYIYFKNIALYILCWL